MMKSRIFQRSFLCMACCLLAVAGCATKPKKATEPKHLMIGTVVLVNEANRFVLIDAGTLSSPVQGQALKTFSGRHETGVLTVSPERKSPFIIADIVKGAP